MDLDRRAAALLDPATPIGTQKSLCDGFYADCLAALPELQAHSTALPTGKALSPSDAARCVLDFVRTRCFLQGVYAAIATRLAANPDTPVEVLYAGCGPLAPLALLLAGRYRHASVRFTLVDIHAQSLDCARRLFELAGVEASLGESWCSDATSLRLPHDYQPQVLLVEVMQRALSREPQLAVVANLLPQCTDDALLVPRRVTVSACLARIARELQPDTAAERIELGTLLELTAESVPELEALLDASATVLPGRRLHVPADAPQGLNLMLRTRIETAPGVELADYDSGLTYPQFIHAIGTVQPGETLQFDYRMGGDPGFQVRREPGPAS